jgi:hypothetical protein
LIDERLPQSHPLPIVDVEHSYTGPARLRATDEHGANPLKVTVPALPARMEEPDDIARERVSAAQVRSLLEVAAVATPTAIVGAVTAAVLLATMCST